MYTDDGEGFAIDFDPGNALAFNRSANPMLDPMVLHAYLASPLTNLDEPVKIESEAVRACKGRCSDATSSRAFSSRSTTQAK